MFDKGNKNTDVFDKTTVGLPTFKWPSLNKSFIPPILLCYRTATVTLTLSPSLRNTVIGCICQKAAVASLPSLSFCYNSGCDVVHNLCSAISQMHSASHLSVYVGSDHSEVGRQIK